MTGDWDCVSAYPLEDYAVSPFWTVTWIPDSCREHWAIAYEKITSSLINAISLPLGADRTRRLGTAARWYLGAPQIFLRSNGRRGNRDTAIILRRLTSFNNDEYVDVVRFWRQGVDKRLAQRRKHRSQTKEERVEEGIKLMREGYISKGLDRVEGKGVVPVEGHCRTRMIAKHPQRRNELPTILGPPPGCLLYTSDAADE